MSRSRRACVLLMSMALGGAGLGLIGPSAQASLAPPGPPGSAMYSPAASCWEAKQQDPAAIDGVYWLLTPLMSEPRAHWCDMTTDGGGWVLVGKGRDSWVIDYDGQGDRSALLSPDTVPMSAATHQLASGEVDELLGGGRVADLADGVRLRRALDAEGTAWQEARMRFARQAGWTWTFEAEHALTGYSFDDRSWSGGTSTSFGRDQDLRRVHNETDADMGYRRGFAFGRNITGDDDPTSHLYSATGGGNALPYTEVYLRPQLTSGPGFDPIPDSGTPEHTRRALPRSTALDSPWGVTGIAGVGWREGNVEVQAFTQAGDRMYVGGNFRHVQRDQAGTDRVEQPFLAAFEVSTGEWVPSFRPVLDEQVRDLATLPSGEVLAGGDFTTANGAPAGAIVALDPETGASSTTWQATLENRLNDSPLRVNALDVAGPYVYAGGALTHATGGTAGEPVYARSLVRLSAADGTPSDDWNPEFNGSVLDVDATDDLARVYASGHFTESRGLPTSRVAALTNDAGAPLVTTDWNPVWTAAQSHQRAIRAVGDRIWAGGSQHNLFSFDADSFELVGGDIFKHQGDVQAITDADGVVYAGCHCKDFDYSDAYTWWDLGDGWTQGHAIGWFGAWDQATGQRLPGFVPRFSMRLNQGIWAIAADSTGTIWAGGDIVTVRTNGQQARWSGGFARFPLVDTTAPPTPEGFRVVAQDATTVTLGWTPAAEPDVRYQVLRDDRPVAVTTGDFVTVPRDGADRYFLRAADEAGNLSASTEVLVPPDDQTDTVVVERGATWHHRYQPDPPPPSWNEVGFDASSWASGPAPLGFGDPGVATDIDTFADPLDRPRTAYFTSTFEVADPTAVVRLRLETIADDGAAVYVNGTEVARANMPDGPLDHWSYATSARRTSVAAAEPVLVEVPVDLLVEGTNTIAAETHLNYRRTRDLTFDLLAVLTESG